MHSFLLKLLIHAYKKAAIAFILFALFISISCGKRKPPLPPVERVAQRAVIEGFQRGNQVLLQWTMPDRNAADNSVLNIDRVDIYRIAEVVDAPLTLSEEEFAARSTLIATQPIDTTDFSRKQYTYVDTLTLSNQVSRLRYAVRFVNSSGQKAAFSNFLLIEPAFRVALPPENRPPEVTQNAVILRWDAPTANIDRSTPANVIGYNVYRSENDLTVARLLNKTPVTSTEFSDRSFQFEQRYQYFVRTVSLGTGGNPVESADSKTVAVLPKDTFAPTPPSSITIAASPNTISIFFAVNPETDVAGYSVYRSTDANTPKANWQLLNPQLLTANTFQDTAVEPGRTFYYYLTATDRFGNVSAPSEVVSEKVPE